MDKSRLKDQNNEIKMEQKDELIITYNELDSFLKTLEEAQAQQFSQLIESHPQIDTNKKEGYFTGGIQVMQEIRYLIDSYINDITYVDSSCIDQSIDRSSFKKQTLYCQSVDIREENIKRILKEIVSVRVLPSNRVDLFYLPPKESIFSNSAKKISEIWVTNRAIQAKRIYIIFQQFVEILQLLTLIEDEIPMFSLENLMDSIEQKPDFPIFKLSDKEIYFCHLREQVLFKKFIGKMNKKFNNNEDTVVIKFKLFPLVIQNKIYFNNQIKVVMDESQIKFNTNFISQFQVHKNELESINFVQELVLEILKKGKGHCRYKDYNLDVISSFNLFLTEQRKENSFCFIRRSEKSMRQFIYFTFYKKLMEIVLDEEGKVVDLKQRKQNQEITSKHYILAIDKVKKYAAINSLPFFMIPEDANEVIEVNTSELEIMHPGDICKLLAYRYILSIKKYKLVTNALEDYQELKTSFQQPFSIVFEKKSPLFKKMGALKGPQILKKQRIRQEHFNGGCILVKTNYARLFIEKYLTELTEKQ